MGRPASITSLLPGAALPEIPNQVIQPSTAVLRWNAPDDLKDLTYGIYYGTTMAELIESKLSKKILEDYVPVEKLNTII